MGWVMRTDRDNSALGGGFREDPEYTSEATGAERQALSRCSSGFTQLSVDMSTSPRALRSVTFVHDRGTGRWAVIVIGSGGEYGSAGTIQVVLAPEGLSLTGAAHHVLGALDSGPLLSPSSLNAAAPGRPLPQAGPEADGSALAQELATVLSMDETRRHTVLDLPGAEDERALVALMGAVPEAMARLVQWSTAYPRPDRNPGSKVVTCPWPPVLAQRHPREHDSAMGAARLLAPSVPLSEVPRGLVWYAGLVLTARPEADSARQRACGLFEAQLDGAPTAADWGRAATTWEAVLERLRPLSDDELGAVVDGAEVPPSVSERWNDAAASRLLHLRRGCLRDLLTHSDDAVRASAWRVAAGEGALYPDLVSWQAELVGAGRPAPREAADLARSTSLVTDVLAATAARGTPGSRWGPRAVAWIKSLGADPRAYGEALPQWQERVLDDLEREPARAAEVVAYARSAPDGAETLMRAVRQVPESLGPLLCGLWQGPAGGVTWQQLLRGVLPADAPPSRVVEVLSLIDDSAPGGGPAAPAAQDCGGGPAGSPVPMELRRAIADLLVTGWSRVVCAETAAALLAFERALPLPRPCAGSAPPARRPAPRAAAQPRVSSTADDPPCWRHCLECVQSSSALGASLVLNAVLLVLALVLWLG
ncbi:hypothetical protein [Actinomyces israelii]|uniref:hypothetical protein n=1 Tax=Actinomyces israelii TaxID=1659 RepID=UPI002557BF62|nr:hypothetical protein [Actinomyces israelii]WKR20334.1 hypothetical protein AIF0345_0205 [Actinomyces israelii]